MNTTDVMVFAGSGISASAPAGLPMFDPMRDAMLHQLDLKEFVESDGNQGSPQVEVARGLAPEPFFLALQHSDIKIVPWLEEVPKRGEPNAAHVALAQLATGGS